MNPNTPSISATEKLKQSCNDAYDTSNDCSHSVWRVLKALVNTNEPYRVANVLIQHLDSKSDGWTEVTLESGWELANDGKVVVGGLAQEPNGHVIVIYPGKKQSTGGYSYEYKGKTVKMRDHGHFPRCMSQSASSFPGTRSRGDKTVWDPWANDARFALVRYWTHDPDGKLSNWVAPAIVQRFLRLFE